MCVCVFVEQEREGRREGAEHIGGFHSLFKSKFTCFTPNSMNICIKSASVLKECQAILAMEEKLNKM